MFVFISLLIACIVQCVFDYYRILTVPYNIFILIAGFIWGQFIKDHKVLEDFTIILQTPAQTTLILYTSIAVFRIAFCLDAHTFYKSILQILLISIPVYLLTAFLVGVLTIHIIGPWDFTTGILFGALCSPTYPILIVRLLKIVATQTRHVHVLLEGEALISTALTFMTNKLIMGSYDGFVVYWYHYVTLALRLTLIGLISGYIVGLIGRFLLRQIYQDLFSITAIICCLPFLTHCTVDYILGGNGTIALSVMGLMMAEEITLLPKTLEAFLTDLWRAIAAGTDIIMTIYCALITTAYIAPNIAWQHFLLVAVTYLMYFFVRFFCFFLFFPILKRTGFGLSFKNLFVCVWSGSKNSISLVLIIVNYHYYSLPLKVAYIFFVHILFLQCFSFVINVSFSSLLLKLLKLTEIPVERQISMNNCMNHIFAKRNKAIATLKMDRFLADTNWSMVNIATAIRHPYKTKVAVQDEEDNFFLGYRTTTCPDCKNELTSTPTSKELKEMTREAKIRILKTKKMSYVRQYENGMVSVEGVRTLTQVVETAMDTEEVIMELDGLHKKFNQEGCFSRMIRNRVQNLNETKKQDFRLPKKPLRRFCFHIVMHKYFELLMSVVIFFNLIPIIIDIYYHLTRKNEMMRDIDYTLAAVNLVFYLIYLLEFIMKILAYSWRRIFQDGFRIYFKSFWNIFDFIVLVGTTIDIIIEYTFLLLSHRSKDNYVWQFGLALEIIRFSRILKLLRALEFLYPSLIRRLDNKANMRMTSTYELGKAYVTGEETVLDLLPHIIAHQKIREEMRDKIENDRLRILKLLGMVQKDRPWIAITVKTKQAIRTILNSMREAINQIKAAGWIDDFEYSKLIKGMDELYKKVNAIRFVKPSAAKVIFREVPWMAGDEKIIDFLFDRVIVKKFEPSDVVFEKGSVADGIYIVVAGLLTLNYSPEKNVLDELEEFGRLPIVDYISSSQLHENVIDYIVSGNCVGELSILTNRPYNCTISAVTHTQVYGLSSTVIKEAMQLSPDPINGLECRIWRADTIRIAVPVLMSIPAYQSLRPEQIKYALERAFVPSLADYKIFGVTDKIQDILLIEGVVADFNSRDVFTAPCYIPRTVQKLILPSSSLMNVPISVETKLMIIPEQNVQEVEIMTLAAKIEDITDDASSINDFILQAGDGRFKRIRNIGIVKSNASVETEHRKLSGDSRGTAVIESELAAIEYFKDTDSESSTSYDYDSDLPKKESKHK